MLSYSLRKKKVLSLILLKNALSYSKDESLTRYTYDCLTIYLHKNIFNTKYNFDEIKKCVILCDIDKDGFISELDIDSFLKKFRLLQDENNSEQILFPTKLMSEEKAEKLLEKLEELCFLKNFPSFFSLKNLI